MSQKLLTKVLVEILHVIVFPHQRRNSRSDINAYFGIVVDTVKVVILK